MSTPRATPRVVCVVQARTGSSRLPDKVLRELGGVPMLEFLLRRLERLTEHSAIPVVVATTDLERDDRIVEIARRCAVATVRGSECDVLGRYVQALDAYPAEHVVRITSDCPLTDPELIDAVVAKHLQRHAQYTTNVLPRTFPKGLDIEVVEASALRHAAASAVDPGEREHVTPYLYRRPETYRLANVRSAMALGGERWTVDTADDLSALRALVAGISDRGLSWRDASWRSMLRVVGRRTPAPVPGAIVLRPAEPGDAAGVLAWRNDAEAVRWSATGAVDPAEHERWFASALDDPARRVLIAECDGEAVGVVRVDVRAGIGTVSIAVASHARGRGHGGAMLGALTVALRDDCQVTELRAVVDPANLASMRAFAANGFVAASSDLSGGAPAPGSDASAAATRVLRRAA